jgi:sporulation protein YlmC with PRC-barrel domain
MINRLVLATALATLMSTAAMAQNPPPAQTMPPAVQPAPGAAAKIMTTLPADAMTVTNFYKQNVYDPGDNKIGEVTDLLVEKDGKVVGAMVAVGGFVGIGEKDVAIPFESMRLTKKDNKWYLVLNTTKDALKSAPGFKYDRDKTTWIPDTRAGTVGSGAPQR